MYLSKSKLIDNFDCALLLLLTFYCRSNERNQLLVCNHLYIFLIPWDRLGYPYRIGVTVE